MEVHQVLNCVRSSYWRCSLRKGVFKNSAKFTGKRLRQSLFFNKVAGLRPWYRCFYVNFVKFLRTYFLENISGRLFLLRDSNFQILSINDFISPTIKDHNTKCICSKCFRESNTKSWIYYQFANFPPGL